MIVPDVNVLVFAFRREAAGHARYAEWLGDLVAGREELGIVDHALVGFLRIVTNRRVFADPAPVADALTFTDALRTAPRSATLPANAAVWEAFERLTTSDPAIRGNLVPDAWLAAACIAHGGRLATADRGVARFPRLDWFDPAAG